MCCSYIVTLFSSPIEWHNAWGYDRRARSILKPKNKEGAKRPEKNRVLELKNSDFIGFLRVVFSPGFDFFPRVFGVSEKIPRVFHSQGLLEANDTLVFMLNMKV